MKSSGETGDKVKFGVGHQAANFELDQIQNSSQLKPSGWPNDTQPHQSCELGSGWPELGGPFGQGRRRAHVFRALCSWHARTYPIFFVSVQSTNDELDGAVIILPQPPQHELFEPTEKVMSHEAVTKPVQQTVCKGAGLLSIYNLGMLVASPSSRGQSEVILMKIISQESFHIELCLESEASSITARSFSNHVKSWSKVCGNLENLLFSSSPLVR